MEYTPEQIEDGVDPEARKASGAGMSGDPKTDIIIGGKQISLKLPGDIQLSSGAAKSTVETIESAFEEWKDLPETEVRIRDIVETELKKLNAAMLATAGKRYYPHERGSRGKWRKHIGDWEGVFGVSTYETMLAARAQGDWEADNYPSGGIPVDWKRAYDEEGKKVTVGPQSSGRFANMRDYIDEFIKLAKKKMQYRPLTGQVEPYEIYEKFKNNALKEIKESLKNLAYRSPTFYYILFDEWLTGRRAQKGEHVAQWLLSPWGFDDITLKENTKKLAKAWADDVSFDMRGKARHFLGKEMAVRIDFKADRHYKKKLAAAAAELAAKQEPSLTEEDGEEINSEEEFIQNLAKEMAKSLVIEI